MAVRSTAVTLLLLTMVTAAAASSHQEEDNEEDGWSSSSDLPLVDLVESPDSRYDPRSEDMRPEALLQQLGADFDARFMSVSQPPSPRDPTGAMYGLGDATAAASTQFSRRQMALLGASKKASLLLLPRGKMPAEVKRLRLEQMALPDGRRVRAGGGERKLRRTLRQFLWARSYCPVVFAWRDLGARFWPRWLREGRCQRRRRSCSFPEGMSCKPSRGAAKTLLRWHCRDWNAAEDCRWIRVRYPVVTACSCAC